MVKIHAPAAPEIASSLRPDDGHRRATFYRSVPLGLHGQLGLLGNLIKRHIDLVALPLRVNEDLPPLPAAHHVGNRPETFERIAELPPARAHIVRFIAHPYQVI